MHWIYSRCSNYPYFGGFNYEITIASVLQSIKKRKKKKKERKRGARGWRQPLVSGNGSQPPPTVRDGGGQRVGFLFFFFFLLINDVFPYKTGQISHSEISQKHELNVIFFIQKNGQI
jgi:hypothetical protein